MNRREFTAAMLAAGAAIPLGITRAAGQTKGGTLNTIIQPEPPILVTAFNQQQPTLTLGGKIYESLLKYGADLKPMPGMAQSWEISPDGLTYTFKLFPGITFHDGKPMTSEDVVFSCMKVLTETHPRARQNFARVASAEAPDPLTVVFKLKQPFAPFLGCFDCTSAPIVPKHIYEGTEFRKNPMNDKAIGTGPFKLKEWVRGSHVHLVRHDGYYRKDEPYLDEIIYRIIPDGASRALALENGTVQLVQWSDIEFFDVQRFKSQKNLEFTTKGYEYFAPHQWLEMNNRVAPMNDKRFRQAIMHLIDRDAMNKRIYFGNAKVATGPISSKTRFYDGKVKRYEFSVEKATELLDEMGLKPGANGKRAELKYLVPPYGEVYQRAGEFFRQSFSKAGIDLVLVGTDMAGWAEKVGNWDYEMTQNLLYQLGDPALGVARTYISSNIKKGILFSNTQGYSNPEVDRLFEEAAARARRGQAAGTLFQGPADPGRGRAGRLDAGARISDHLRQGVQEHRDDQGSAPTRPSARSTNRDGDQERRADRALDRHLGGAAGRRDPRHRDLQLRAGPRRSRRSGHGDGRAIGRGRSQDPRRSAQGIRARQAVSGAARHPSRARAHAGPRLFLSPAPAGARPHPGAAAGDAAAHAHRVLPRAADRHDARRARGAGGRKHRRYAVHGALAAALRHAGVLARADARPRVLGDARLAAAIRLRDHQRRR